MIMSFVCHIFWLSCLVPGYITAKNQVPVSSRVHRNPRPCNGAVHSALVEKFFNYVFTEFRDNPPICLCVQMCVDQYSYCFPNACMKQNENQSDTTTKKDVQSYHVPKDTNPFVGFYDDVKMSDLVSLHAHTTPSTPSTENQFIENFHTDLFKQQYNAFKNRRIPKFQFRYNLRELVKHRNEYLSANIDADRAIWPYKVNKVSSQILYEIMKPHNNIFLRKSQSLGNKLSYYHPENINYYKREVSKTVHDKKKTILKSLNKVNPLSDNNAFSIEYFAFDDLLDDGIVKKNNSRKRNEYFIHDMKNAETILDSQIEQVNLLRANLSSEIRMNNMKLEEQSLKYLNSDKINIVNTSEHDLQPTIKVNGTFVSAFEPKAEYHPEIARVQNSVGFVDRPVVLIENVDARIKNQLSTITRSMLEAKKRNVLPPKKKRTKPFVLIHLP